jgi:hypothetical protein
MSLTIKEKEECKKLIKINIDCITGILNAYQGKLKTKMIRRIKAASENIDKEAITNLLSATWSLRLDLISIMDSLSNIEFNTLKQIDGLSGDRED